MITFLILIISWLLSTMSYAQKKEIEINRNKNGIIERIKFPVGTQDISTDVTSTITSFMGQYLEINEFDEFIKEQHNNRNNEFLHEHFDHYYKGVRVDEKGKYIINIETEEL